MSNKDYYAIWLKFKKKIQETLEDDLRIQELANTLVGIKPQATAIEIVARVYCKYCEIYNKLCECYDQMEQVQRRPYIKVILDAITCRLLELKLTLEEVEAFEITYVDNALQQMLIAPHDVQVLCPFFYPFEIRDAEMQYIIDEIFKGNRIGDPTPTPSEIDRRHQLQLEEQQKIREEKEAEIKRKLAMGEDIEEAEELVELTAKEQEELRLKKEYERHILNIQRMERTRVVTRENIHKKNKDANLYLELAGLKTPPVKECIRIRASQLIQNVYRRFMLLKREYKKEYKLKEKLGMIIPSWLPPSAKIQLEKVKEDRRVFRRKYYDKWLQENIKEKSRVLRLRKDDIMEDISDEVRNWFKDWYKEVRLFDEFPWPEEGGTILVVTGETFTIPEFIEWQLAEEKRLKAEAGSPKSKEQIKAEKIAAREEKKRIEMEARDKEKKRIADYKKQRLNPENDPGVFIRIGKNLDPLLEAWHLYENQWKAIDTPDAAEDVLKGFIKLLITENAYKDTFIELRPIVDDLMRTELAMLKSSLKNDYLAAGVAKPPQSKKRKKPKKVKAPKVEKHSPAFMFQRLVDEGIIKKYPPLTLDDYWGDRNYVSADLRAIQWTPSFTPPCYGDIREQVRVRCVLTLGSSCPNAMRAQLIAGPKASGKRSLIYAIATETNSILIDLSPMNVYDKFPGKNLKTMFQFVNRVSRLMQPTVILVEDADKLFYKKVPKEEKMFDPTRLSKDFFKEIIKPINNVIDKILVLGTANEPWVAKGPAMYKVFPNLILLPRSDYGSITLILSKILMQFHGVKRDFNVHSAAQTLRGYDIKSIIKGVNSLMNGERVAKLYHQPLDPIEVVSAVLEYEGSTYTDEVDYEIFKEWYLTYTPWGEKYKDYMHMLEMQLGFKLKAEKKK